MSGLSRQRTITITIFAAIAVAAAAQGCASSGRVAALEETLEPVRERMDRQRGDGEAPVFAGDLESYVAYAMERSPALRASYEEWSAAVAAVGSADKLPEPTLSYGYFLRSVETRVGPQRHRLGLRQRLPWLSKLDASVDARAATARAAREQFEGHAVVLRRAISDAYWRLWGIKRAREVRVEQSALLDQLAASARTRLEVGKAGVSDLAQIDLRRSRVADIIVSLDAEQRAASARLVGAIGAPAGTATPIGGPTSVDPHRPADGVEALVSNLSAHPRVRQQDEVAAMYRGRQDGARAERYPNLELGLDYIETGEREDADPPDNGKDSIVASVMVGLPFWGGAYDADEDAEAARQRAAQARSAEVIDTLTADLFDANARLEDSGRRIALFRDTLIPQARTAYTATLGDYETGRAGVATMLTAFSQLLELNLSLIAAQMDHARAWAALESAAGRPLTSTRVSP